MDGNGGMGWWLLVIKDHSHPFPAFSNSKFFPSSSSSPSPSPSSSSSIFIIIIHIHHHHPYSSSSSIFIIIIYIYIYILNLLAIWIYGILWYSPFFPSFFPKLPTFFAAPRWLTWAAAVDCWPAWRCGKAPVRPWRWKLRRTWRGWHGGCCRRLPEGGLFVILTMMHTYTYIYIIYGIWYMVYDIWYMIYDTWYMIYVL